MNTLGIMPIPQNIWPKGPEDNSHFGLEIYGLLHKKGNCE